MLGSIRGWPLAARIELLSAAGWMVVGLVAAIAVTEAPAWARWGFLYGGALLALPFAAVGGVLLWRPRAGSILALLVAAVCLGGVLAGIAGEALGGSTFADAMDRGGAALIAFGLSGILHALSGGAGPRLTRG